MIPISIRVASQSDLAFIKDSWRKCMKYIYPNQYAIDFDQKFNQQMSNLIENSITLVAYLESNPEEVISYLIHTSFRGNQVIHFAYTKLDARRQGMMKQLLQLSNPGQVPIIFTHPAKNEKIMQSLLSHYLFDPSIVELL